MPIISKEIIAKGWKLDTGSSINGYLTLSHAKHGSMSLSIVPLPFNCGAMIFGGFYFNIRDENECQEALTDLVKSNMSYYSICTVRSDNIALKMLKKAGMKEAENTKYKSKYGVLDIITLFIKREDIEK